MNQLRFHSTLAQWLLLFASVGVWSQGCAPAADEELELDEQVGASASEGESRESTARAGEPEIGEHSAPLVAFQGCNADQRFELEQAVLGARWLIEAAIVDFDTARHRGLRDKWLGPNRSDPGIFQLLFAMRDMAYDFWAISVRCEPASQSICSGKYAYKHQNEASLLHVCPLYFDFDHNQADYAPTFGVSQVGGLLHELSHVMGTEDLEYKWFNLTPNYAASQLMVAVWPEAAMNNADNWRHYLMQVD